LGEASDPQDARRVAILEAATRVFTRYGFKKTSMDDLARAAGLSRQGLYLHFSTKEALFKGAVLFLVEKVRAAERAALSNDALGVEERLLAAFEAIHGEGMADIGAEQMTELLEAASQLVEGAIPEFERGIVSDVARVLRSSGVADAWKGNGISAKDLAAHLLATSDGLKHRPHTAAEYREGMKLAIRIVCRS
jgi:AcrR family transcriptional regulator